MNVVIVSGGLNTRFLEYSIFPKILLPYKQNDSILSYNASLFKNDNLYLIINEKYYDQVYNYITINKLNIHVIKSTNTDGSYQTILEVLPQLPNENILFVWSDLILKSKPNINEDDMFGIYESNGNYRFTIKNQKIVNCKNNGTIPGIYYIKYKNNLIKTNDEDIIEFLSNQTFISRQLNVNIIEFRDINIYKEYISNQHHTIVNRFFNKIEISNNTFKKTVVNNSYIHLIENEIEWYKLNTTNFAPKLLNYSNNSIEIEYLKDYISFHEYLSFTKDVSILNNLIEMINKLHNSNKISISKEVLYNDLKKEFYDKVLNRVLSVKSMIIDFDEMKFKDLINKGFQYIIDTIDTSHYYFTHGDLNGSNILIHPKTKDIKFIDPRGYFGNTKHYGLAEYDFAKVLYCLFGYDDFNNNHYLFSKSNYDRPKQIIETNLFSKVDYIMMSIIYICLSSYISNNIMKVNISYHYGMELLTKYLEDESELF